MPFDHLLLPLLGGYWFITHFNLLRFRAFGLSRYRLLFEAALYGFLALCLSFLLTRFVIEIGSALPVVTALLGWWKRIVPFPYLGAAIGALAIAGLSPYVLNRFERWNSLSCSERAIRSHGDLLLEMLFDAHLRKQPVMITLSSGKVYVGLITLSSNLSPAMPHIVVLPTLSGYRDPETQVVRFTTGYERIYSGILRQQDEKPKDKALAGLGAKDFQIVIPMPDIRMATPYSRKVPENYFRP